MYAVISINKNNHEEWKQLLLLLLLLLLYIHRINIQTFPYMSEIIYDDDDMKWKAC